VIFLRQIWSLTRPRRSAFFEMTKRESTDCFKIVLKRHFRLSPNRSSVVCALRVRATIADTSLRRTSSTPEIAAGFPKVMIADTNRKRALGAF
jgi:hypothetical protein